MAEEIILWVDGFVKGFKYSPYDTQLFANVLGQFENKQVQFCIRSTPKKPSKEAHAYYRGVVLPAASQSEQFRGWVMSDIHLYFVGQYLKDVKTLEMDGNIVTIVTTKSTGDISNKRFSEFVDAVKQELATMGVNCPEPVKQ